MTQKVSYLYIKNHINKNLYYVSYLYTKNNINKNLYYVQ